MFYSVINKIYLFFIVLFIMGEGAFLRNLKGVRLSQINSYQIRQSQRSKQSQFFLASQKFEGKKIFVTSWLFKFFWSQKKEYCFFNNRTALRDAARKERYYFVRPLEAYK